MTTHETLETYCGVLREALTFLVEAVEYAASMPTGADQAQRYWYSPQWALDHARDVLAMDAHGQQAARDLALHSNLAALAYVFADFLHERLLATPRTAGARTVAPDEVLAALRELEALTTRTYAPSGAEGEPHAR